MENIDDSSATMKIGHLKKREEQDTSVSRMRFLYQGIHRATLIPATQIPYHQRRWILSSCSVIHLRQKTCEMQNRLQRLCEHVCGNDR